MFNECQRANKDVSWKQGVNIKHEEVWPRNRDENGLFSWKGCLVSYASQVPVFISDGLRCFLPAHFFCFLFFVFFSLSFLSPELLKY